MIQSIDNNKIFLFINILLIILIITFIFSNSLKDGEASNAQSAPIVEAVETVLDPKDEVPTPTFNFIVRKAAHITEFSALGVTLGGMVCCVNRLTKRQSDEHKRSYVIMALGIGLLIAIIDEFIQSFTGRTNSITDVLIDFMGVVIGIGSVLVVSHWTKQLLNVYIKLNRMQKEENN